MRSIDKEKLISEVFDICYKFQCKPVHIALTGSSVYDDYRIPTDIDLKVYVKFDDDGDTDVILPRLKYRTMTKYGFKKIDLQLIDLRTLYKYIRKQYLIGYKYIITNQVIYSEIDLSTLVKNEYNYTCFIDRVIRDIDYELEGYIDGKPHSSSLYKRGRYIVHDILTLNALIIRDGYLDDYHFSYLMSFKNVPPLFLWVVRKVLFIDNYILNNTDIDVILTMLNLCKLNYLFNKLYDPSEF